MTTDTDKLWDSFAESDTDRLVKRGRYYFPDRDPLMRVSNMVGVLADDFGLTRWRQMMAVTGFADHPELLAQAAEAKGTTFDEVFSAAVDHAGGGVKRDAGTAFHNLSERIDLGHQHDAREFQPVIDAYHKAIADWGFEIVPEYIERVVAINSVGCAGTFDRILRHTATGRQYVADIKTGGLRWFKFGQQLAIYANADEMWNGDDETFEAMPPVSTDTGIVIAVNLEAASVDLWEVDLVEPWEWVQTATEVLEWRRRAERKNVLARPWGETIPVGEHLDQRRAHIRRRIEALKEANNEAFMELAARWPDGVPTPRQTDQPPTQEQLDTLAALLDHIEGRHQVPFFGPEVDPGAEPAKAIAPPADVAALRARLQELPLDLVPTADGSIFVNRCTQDDYNTVNELARDAYVTASDRLGVAALHYTDIEKAHPEATWEEVTAIIDSPGPLWTQADLDTLDTISAAIHAGVLCFDDEGAVICTRRALELLVTAHGSKSALLKAARTTGISNPSSSADVAADPLLAAATLATA